MGTVEYLDLKCECAEIYDDFIWSMNEDLVVILKDKASTALVTVFHKIYKDVVSDELLRRNALGRVDADANVQVHNKKTDINGRVRIIVAKLLTGRELENDKLVENLRNCWEDHETSEK